MHVFHIIISLEQLLPAQKVEIYVVACGYRSDGFIGAIDEDSMRYTLTVLGIRARDGTIKQLVLVLVDRKYHHSSEYEDRVGLREGRFLVHSMKNLARMCKEYVGTFSGVKTTILIRFA